MHKILPIFIFTFLLPFCANATNSVTCNLNNNQDACVSYNGCEYKHPMGGTPSCSPCNPHNFNNTNQNSTLCTACTSASYTDTILDGKEYDPSNESTGNIECPWKCASGWFIDHNGNSCIACPNSNSGIVNYSNNDDEHIGVCTCNGGNTYLIQTTINSSHSYYCGQCGLGLQPSTNNGVATCPTCPDGSNNVHGELASDTGTRLECRCPTNDGYWDSSTQQCACHNNKILTQLSSGEWVCSSCDATKHETFNNGECVCQQGYYRPTNSTAACTKCPDFASTDDVNSHSINDCHCRSDYGQYPADSSTVPGDFVCNKCDDNATVDSSSVQCKCDENYYGNGLQNSCVKCPAGTTKSAGGSVNQPSTQSACHFTSGATKFCIQSNVRTTTNDGYVCFTPTNVTYTY